MTGWNEHGHARPTGLPIDRYLGGGDLQDAESCGYAPTSVLAELDVDRVHGDPMDQFRAGRIALRDGTVLERGGAFNCVWAVTRTPRADHSGVAGEPEATTKGSCCPEFERSAHAHTEVCSAFEENDPARPPQIAATDPPTRVPAPDPVKPAATILAGAGMVPVSWGEAVKVATPASRAASVSRTALADRAIVETLTERDDAEEWADRLAHAISLAAGIDIGEHSNLNDPWEQALAAAPGIAAQALRQAAEEIRAASSEGPSNAFRTARRLDQRADELERGTDQ